MTTYTPICPARDLWMWSFAPLKRYLKGIVRCGSCRVTNVAIWIDVFPSVGKWLPSPKFEKKGLMACCHPLHYIFTIIEPTRYCLRHAAPSILNQATPHPTVWATPHPELQGMDVKNLHTAVQKKRNCLCTCSEIHTYCTVSIIFLKKGWENKLDVSERMTWLLTRPTHASPTQLRNL